MNEWTKNEASGRGAVLERRVEKNLHFKKRFALFNLYTESFFFKKNLHIEPK